MIKRVYSNRILLMFAVVYAMISKIQQESILNRHDPDSKYAQHGLHDRHFDEKSIPISRLDFVNQLH